MHTKIKKLLLSKIYRGLASNIFNSLTLIVLLYSTINAGSVTLDQTFNGTGFRIQPIVNSSLASSVAIQSDGKIVLGGWTFNGEESFAAARFNGGGTLDTSFDGDGILVRTVSNFNRGNSLSLQTDGKILIGGTRYFGDTNNDFAILRHNINGTQDNSFDANGLAVANVNGFSDDICYDMALQNDGKIVMVGTTAPSTTIGENLPTDIAVTRFNADGSPDTSFNGGVMLVIRFQNVSEAANAVVIQNDGKIVIGGFLFTGFKNDFLMMRLTANGSLDTTFGTNGLVITSVSGTSNSIASLALQNDGKIVAAGSNYLARYDSNGTLDSSFGNNGSALFPHSVSKIKILNNGKILGNGSLNSRVAVSRFNANGLIDATFNGTGTVTAAVGSQCFSTSLAVQSDNKIVVSGSCITSTNHFAVFRFQENIAKGQFDFDGDGKADISVFRPDNGTWYLQQSSAGFTGLQFGISTDKLVPADYDGDGKTDVAVVRNGVWYLQRSQAGFAGVQFGDGNDIPVPADYDGDGKAELAVFRPSNGYWYILNLATNQFTATLFGNGSDKPVPADYDGDGKTDLAVNRGGSWYIQRSQLGFTGIQFGDGNDKTVPADYDGDGKADIAVFRPSTGAWYLLQSQAGFAGITFGLGTDIPAAADYDGDGKADLAVVRIGNWYVNRTTQGFIGIQFGTATDKPLPNAFVR